MAEYTEMTDRTKRVVLVPDITRAFWSCRRAWHGDTVKIHIETRNVPDGTPVFVEIWEDDSPAGKPDDFLKKLGDYRIQNGKCVVDYKIDWTRKALGKDLDLAGEELNFLFFAVIKKYELRKRSSLLYVDLAEFRFST
jgi:hypothetical protein